VRRVSGTSCLIGFLAVGLAAGLSQSGAATPELRPSLGAASQAAVLETITDASTGVRIGIPFGVVEAPKIERWGRSWTSADRRISIDTLNFGNTRELKNWYNNLRHKPGRRITRDELYPDRFVLEGSDGAGEMLSYFHIQAHSFNRESRGLSIVYSASAREEIKPVAEAIAQSFEPFPVKLVLAAAKPKESEIAGNSGPSVPAGGTAQTGKAPDTRPAPQVPSTAEPQPQTYSKPLEITDPTARARIAELERQLAEQTKKLQEYQDQEKNKSAALQRGGSPLPAEDDKAGVPALGNRYAFVVGNNKYPNLPPDQQLSRAVNDAKAVGDMLEKLGFKVVRGENLDLREMKKRFWDFAEKVKPGDMAVMYYAGHGISIGASNYLLPTDVVNVDPEQEGRARDMAWAEADIIGYLQERQAKVTIIVLDACRSNPFKRPGVTRGSMNSAGLAKPLEAEGIFAIYSAGFDQAALDSLGPEDRNANSVFTRVFVPALARTDTHLVEIMVDVKEEVAELAATIKRKQIPAYYDQARGRVFLAGRATAVGGPFTPMPSGAPRLSK
jgi:caspase domain-containing protein